MVDSIVAEHGRLDIVVNNAGGAPYALAADASPRLHDKILGLNLTAPLLVAQAANAVMQGQEQGGSIVNISSISAQRPSRSEEHTSELQSLMRHSYAVFCLKKQ